MPLVESHRSHQYHEPRKGNGLGNHVHMERGNPSEEFHEEGRGFDARWLGESVQDPVGIVEYRPAFEASHLSGRRAASRPDIVDEPLVGAERFRGGNFRVLTDLLNHVGVHWRLHIKIKGR